jgi:hypothetical protein
MGMCLCKDFFFLSLNSLERMPRQKKAKERTNKEKEDEEKEKQRQ